MGCSASVVLLLRSVDRADCSRMCSRQDQMSVEAATPTLQGYTSTSSPVTIIIMVTRTPPTPHQLPNACVIQHICVNAESAVTLFSCCCCFLLFHRLFSNLNYFCILCAILAQSNSTAHVINAKMFDFCNYLLAVFIYFGFP